MSEDRLARIEAKLDKLSDAIVAIARTEEQIATIFNQQRVTETKLELHASELSKLRDRTHELSNTTIMLSASCSKVDRMQEQLSDIQLDTHDNTKMTKRISWAAGVFFSALVLFILNDY